LGHDRIDRRFGAESEYRPRRKGAGIHSARGLSAIMPESIPTIRDAARPRLRSIVTTILLLMISIMIVRDIFVRRWSAAPPPSSDITERSR
jgi:hypothetical protein